VSHVLFTAEQRSVSSCVGVELVALLFFFGKAYLFFYIQGQGLPSPFPFTIWGEEKKSFSLILGFPLSWLTFHVLLLCKYVHGLKQFCTNTVTSIAYRMWFCSSLCYCHHAWSPSPNLPTHPASVVNLPVPWSMLAATTIHVLGRVSLEGLFWHTSTR
jgi:hypothetical protein